MIIRYESGRSFRISWSENGRPSKTPWTGRRGPDPLKCSFNKDENCILRVLYSAESYRSDVKYDLTFGPDVNEVIWIITDSSNKRTLISNEPNQVNDTVRGRS